jgi:hypothetical protein
MALNMFSSFFVGQLNCAHDAQPAPLTPITGIASLMAHLTALGTDHAIHLCDGAEAPISKTLHMHPTGWSLWGLHEDAGTWHLSVIGGRSLDDIAVEMLQLLQSDDMKQVAICPPGTPMPRAFR